MKIKTLKRISAACVAMTMAIGMLVGCGNSPNSGSNTEVSKDDNTSADSGDDFTQTNEETSLNTDQEVELVMYVISDRPAGQDVVDENLNAILKEKMNCTLKINWIGWAEYVNKYPLLFASGEEFDLAYSSNWVKFTSLAQKGAFKNLDELWPTYAPDNYAAATEAAKAQATINGHYYCVPTQLGTYNAYGAVYRGDLVEGSDWKGVIETFEDIEEYCDIVKATHPEIEPMDQYATEPEWYSTYIQSCGYAFLSKGINYLWFDPTEEKPTVVYSGQCEETPYFLEMMKRWNEKGFFSKSALSDSDSQKTQNGKAAMKVQNIDNYRSFSILHPEWDFHYANLVKNVAHQPYTQDCMVISNSSRNPERAMAFWNLLTTDQEVYDALMYGVLDTTYSLNEKGEYLILDTDLYAESAMWAARTDELNRQPQGTPEEYYSTKEMFENSIVAGQGTERFTNFVFDTSAIETELAACSNAQQQYWWPLELAYTDVVTGLSEYQNSMQAAGIDKVIAEAQRQLDEYSSSH